MVGLGVETEEVRKVVDIVHRDIQVPVIVEVEDDRAAACLRGRDGRPQRLADVLEPAVAEIAVHDLALLVSGFGRELLHLRIDMTVGEEQVQPAVVVEVQEGSPPAQPPGVDAHAAHEGPVVAVAVPAVAVQRRGVPGEVGLEDVHEPVAVVVANRDTHPRLGLAVLAERATGANPDVLEGPVMAVSVQGCRVRVVGHVKIHPPVVVEVQRGDTEPEGALGLRDPGAVGHVLEPTITQVAVEDVGASGKTRRAASHLHALVPAQTRIGRRCGLQVEVDVVGGKEIQIAVPIVVQEGTAGAPARAPIEQPGRDRGVLEHPVTPVSVQVALAVVRHEEVLVSVVVVVAHADPLPPAPLSQAGLAGDVLESPVAPVPVQVVRRLLSLWKALEGRPVDQEEVQPAVVVVVERRHPAAGGFEEIAVVLSAPEDGDGVEPGLARHVHEREVQAGHGIREGCPGPHPAGNQHGQGAKAHRLSSHRGAHVSGSGGSRYGASCRAFSRCECASTAVPWLWRASPSR